MQVGKVHLQMESLAVKYLANPVASLSPSKGLFFVPHLCPYDIDIYSNFFSRTFNSKNAVQSRAKAKHGGK